jgi:hypothetical protein
MYGRKFVVACTLVIAPLLWAQTTPETDAAVPPERELKVIADSGTSGRIAKFDTDGTTTINSNMYDVGGYIGINTDAVWRRLTIDAGSASNEGLRIRKVADPNNPYFDITMNTSGSYAYGVLQIGDSIAWRPLALQPNGGRVGINTAAPAQPLHVYSAATVDAIIGAGPDPAAGPAMNFGYGGGSFGRGAGFINVRPDASASAPNPSLRLMTADVIRLFITNTGNVGVGSATPTERLEVTGGSIFLNQEDSGFVIDATGNKRFGLVKNSGRNTELRYLSTVAFKVRRVTSGTDVRSGSASSDVPLVFTAQGNVGIGSETGNDSYRLHVTGNAHFTGNVTADGALAAKYQDVAEWVPSREDLAPGTVVVLDALRGNAVIASSAAYDTAVAGVVSEQPGLILGQAAADKEQIATTGRVRVKVDASSAPIRVGDLLVTSNKPGFAMKSIPVNVSGISMHRPGTIVGKALESMEGGEGEILVLLSLQ